MLGCHVPTYSLLFSSLCHRPHSAHQRAYLFLRNCWPSLPLRLKSPANLGKILLELFFISFTSPFWFSAYVYLKTPKMGCVFWKTGIGLQPKSKGLNWKCWYERGGSLHGLGAWPQLWKDSLSEFGQITTDQNLMLLNINWEAELDDLSRIILGRDTGHH